VKVRRKRSNKERRRRSVVNVKGITSIPKRNVKKGGEKQSKEHPDDNPKEKKSMNLIYVSKCHASPKYLPLPVLCICATFLRTIVLNSLVHHICSIIGHAKSRMRLEMEVKKVERWVGGGNVVWRGVEIDMGCSGQMEKGKTWFPPNQG
jgi:hypothetical protein